jgi:hypothetical protein
MKRFCLLVGILFIANECIAQERPVWEDVCPQGLHDAVYRDIRWFWPDNTKATQEIYNYWAIRRTEFENSLAVCDTVEESLRSGCYSAMQSKQLSDNEIYKDKLETKKITSQIWRDNNKISNPIMFNLLPR